MYPVGVGNNLSYRFIKAKNSNCIGDEKRSQLYEQMFLTLQFFATENGRLLSGLFTVILSHQVVLWRELLMPRKV